MTAMRDDAEILGRDGVDDLDAILDLRSDPSAVLRSVRDNAAAIFTWDYERSRAPLSKLYEKAKTAQWNATTDLPWDTEVDQELLAATSPKFMVRALGRRWAPLHKTVYACGVLGVLHYLWLVKADLREPLLYAGILAVLLIARIPAVARRITSGRRAGSPPAPRRSPPPPPATSRS